MVRNATPVLVTPDLIRGPRLQRRDGSRIKSGMTKKGSFGSIARRVGDHRGELTFGRKAVAQHRPAFELADIPLRLKNTDMEVEQHAWFDGLPELHAFDAHEINELARAAEAERLDRISNRLNSTH